MEAAFQRPPNGLEHWPEAFGKRIALIAFLTKIAVRGQLGSVLPQNMKVELSKEAKRSTFSGVGTISMLRWVKIRVS